MISYKIYHSTKRKILIWLKYITFLLMNIKKKKDCVSLDTYILVYYKKCTTHISLNKDKL